MLWYLLQISWIKISGCGHPWESVFYKIPSEFYILYMSAWESLPKTKTQAFLRITYGCFTSAGSQGMSSNPKGLELRDPESSFLGISPIDSGLRLVRPQTDKLCSQVLQLCFC